jgi:glycerophosphoryl diester phosphodiesterase
VSGFDAVALRRIAELAPGLPRSFTLARDRLGISRRRLPRRLPGLVERTRVQAVTLHHSLAGPAAIDAAHRCGVAVYVWTVDNAALAERLVGAGADGIITNDPRIFREFQT